jgi:plasmid maintenance system antidote protein VapI
VTQRYKTLQDFVEQTGTTHGELARQLGIKSSMVSLLCSRRRQPSLPLAIKIHHLTGVPYEAMVIDESKR